MTVVRLAPNGTVSNTGTVTGAASAHEALADDSDASYVTYPGAYYSWLNLADLSLPTGAVVTAVKVFYRAEFTGTTSIPAATKVYAGSQSASDTRNVSAFVAEYVGANIYGGLSDADVDGATITISSSFSLAGSLVVYKAGLEVHYFVQPTVDVTAPTGTITSNIPTVEWTPTFDPDALYGQYYKQIKIFSEAQYTAGGFDPSTSTATNDAGTVYNSAGSHGFNDVLSNGNYRAYTRVASYNQPDQWSAWNYEAFTVNAPLPGVPTITATAVSATGWITVELDDTAGTASTSQFELQSSTDGGTTWAGVRTYWGEGTVGFSGTAVQVVDREAPNGVTVQYRARAYNTTNETYSGWTAPASAAWASEKWFLVPGAFPNDTVILNLRSYSSTSETANQGVFRPLGSSLPIVVSDVRGPVTGQITVLTNSQTERDALWKAIGHSVPCLLKGPPSADIPDRWVMVGDSTSERLVDKGWSHQHDDTLPWTEVARPEGARA